jgi:uncharacterized protein YacL
MQDLIQALLVPFVAGFIVQRFLEILDPFTTAKIKDPNTKKMVLGFASLAIGCILSGFVDLRLFHALQPLFAGLRVLPHTVDVFFSGVFISAGTEGFNSLMKFANYKKEASKADAARKRSQLSGDELHSVNP